jgi:hypothetical protein
VYISLVSSLIIEIFHSLHEQRQSKVPHFLF